MIEYTLKYFKYYEANWTQPILSDFGAMGGSAFAVAQNSCYSTEYFWHVFAETPSQWHSAAGVPQWVAWWNPHPMKVTNLHFAGHSAGNIHDFVVQGSNDFRNWVDLKSVSNDQSTADFDVDLSSNTNFYYYYRIYITSCYYYSGGNPYPLIAPGFQITAKEKLIQESTSSDYDFCHIDKMLVDDTISHKYYQIEPWFQPTFSQNTYEYDIVGRTTKNIYHAKFELTASHASQAPWYAFNKSLTANDCWWTNHGQTSVSNPCWLNFHSNIKMKFDHITMMNENTSPENFKHGYVQASNDGANYTNIAEFTGTNTASYVTHVQIEHPDFYHHYRLYFDDSYSTAGVSIQLINFEGWGRVIKEAREDEPHDLSVEYTTFEVETEPEYTFYKYNGTDTPIISTNEDYDYSIKNKPTFTARIQ